MKEGFIKDTYERTLREFQTVLSIAYLGAVGIGMLFNYQKFSEFGINIFDYADVFDFLIAPFSDLNVILFSAVSIAIGYLFFRFDSWHKRKFPKSYSKMNFGLDKKSWWNLARIILSLGIIIIYLYLGANFYGTRSKEQIKNQPPIEVRYSDNEIKIGKLIGKTREIVFLLEGKQVKAIPITSLVKEFDIK